MSLPAKRLAKYRVYDNLSTVIDFLSLSIGHNLLSPLTLNCLNWLLLDF